MPPQSIESGLLARPRPTLDRWIYGLGLVGVLVVVHLTIMVDRGFDRGCFGFSEPTAVVECEAVLQSDAGTLFGVSNSIWGLLFYLALVGLSAAGAFGWTGRVALWRRLRAGLISVGVLYSGYLVYVQTTLLGAYCKLCLISASIVAVLFALVVADLLTSSSKPSHD